VLAEDRLQDLRMTRRTRTFEDVSDRDVIDQIAAAQSLRTEVDIDGPTYPVLAQVNQSDLAFLRERAQAIDAEVWVAGDTLFAQARGRRNLGEVSLVFGGGLKELSVLADVAQQRTSLSVNGWDVETKESVSFAAEEAAIRSELNGFESGSAVLQRAFGNRVESVVHQVPFSQDEARCFAEAHFRKMARRFVTGRAVAEGDGRIRVGTHVEITNVGPLFEGAYYVTEVRHTYDGQKGFRTHFCIERPGLNTA
jgi:phage protein D